MWRRPSLNAAMPVPTYHPAAGAESHTHSPGRKSLLVRNAKSLGFPGSIMPNNVFPTQTAGAGLLGNQALLQTPYFAQSSSTTSGGNLSCPDPFDESTYFEWLSSGSSGQPSDCWGDGRPCWPMMNPRIANNKQATSSDTAMSDFVPSQASDVMQISGSSLEDDPMSLKVPTNTPTGGEGEGEELQGAGAQLSLPHDFASSLTQSLLNQPFPLPMAPPHSHSQPEQQQQQQQQQQQPQQQVQQMMTSRRAGSRHASSAQSAGAALLGQPLPFGDGAETRKSSQPLLDVEGLGSVGGGGGGGHVVPASMGGPGAAGNENASPALLQHAFSTGARNLLSGTFGTDITNMMLGDTGPVPPTTTTTNNTTTTAITSSSSCSSSAAAGQTDSAACAGAGNVESGGGGNSGGGNVAPKRTRTFTPASVKAIDEEDEPRRASPRVRVPV